MPVTGTYAIGQHSLAASWAGDSKYKATAIYGTHMVVAAPTTTTILSSLNPALSGSNVTFTATVSSSYGTPAGTVTFSDGATTLGAATLNGGGVATYATSSLAVGTHTITASYAANGNFAASSASLSEVVHGRPSTISLSGVPNPAYVGQSVILTATVSGAAGTPTGTVTFMDGAATLGSATVNGAGVSTLTATFSAAGVHNLTAIYGGDSVYDASTPAQFTETVLLNPTEITVSAIPNPAVVFQAILFTAVQTSLTGYVATGTVTFYANGNAMGTGALQEARALFSTAKLGPGTYAITVSYPGSTGAMGSTSPPFTLVVQRETSQTSLTSSPNPAAAGTPVTLTARVAVPAGTPTGTVIFYDGNTVLDAAPPLNGQATATYATSTLGLGAHAITAAYSGDGNVLPSTSAVLNENIVPYVGDFSISATPAAASIYQGQSARFAVTVTSTGGFNQPVALSCEGLPAQTTCGFSPMTIANGQGTATMSLQTSAPQHVISENRAATWGTRTRTITLAALVLLYIGRRRRWRAWLSLLLLSLGLGVSACAGPAQIAGGTPGGKYAVLVTGSASSSVAPPLTHSTSVTVNVKPLF